MIWVASEPPRVRSPFKIALHQAIALSQRGHSTKFLCQERGLNDVLNVFRLPLSTISFDVLRPVPFISKLINALTKSLRTIEGGTIDIDLIAHCFGSVTANHMTRANETTNVIAHSTLAPLMIMLQYSRSKFKKICHLHDVPISQMLSFTASRSASKFMRVVDLWERWVIDHSDALICTTNEASNAWKDRSGVKPMVVYPGCSPKQIPRSSDRKYVLALTSWERGRFPLRLLDFLEPFDKSEVNLIVAGKWQDVQLRTEMLSAIRRRGLTSQVTLEEGFSETRLDELYFGARCIVYPFRSKLIMTCLEAASHGVPIIAPHGSEAWQLLSQGKHGIAVDENSDEQFTDAVASYLDDDLMLDHSTRIHEFSMKNTWNEHAAKIERIMS